MCKECDDEVPLERRSTMKFASITYYEKYGTGEVVRTQRIEARRLAAAKGAETKREKSEYGQKREAIWQAMVLPPIHRWDVWGKVGK